MTHLSFCGLSDSVWTRKLLQLAVPYILQTACSLQPSHVWDPLVLQIAWIYFWPEHSKHKTPNDPRGPGQLKLSWSQLKPHWSQLHPADPSSNPLPQESLLLCHTCRKLFKNLLSPVQHLPMQGLSQQVIPCFHEHPNLFCHGPVCIMKPGGRHLMFSWCNISSLAESFIFRWSQLRLLGYTHVRMRSQCLKLHFNWQIPKHGWLVYKLCMDIK